MRFVLHETDVLENFSELTCSGRTLTAQVASEGLHAAGDAASKAACLDLHLFPVSLLRRVMRAKLGSRSASARSKGLEKRLRRASDGTSMGDFWREAQTAVAAERKRKQRRRCITSKTPGPARTRRGRWNAVQLFTHDRWRKGM